MTTPVARTVPGLVALLGSGETAAAGRRVLERVLAALPEPRTVAVLDTPAGFQPNHRRVAEKVAEFIAEKLADRHPHPSVVETRPSDAGGSGEESALRAISSARCIFAGPGSPTYMIRELRGSPYIDALQRAHAAGAALCIASAAALAIGAYTIPVYEIFKVGEPVAWREGLDLLSPYGLRLALVPHWNNSEGGAEVDTRFCYLGERRFDALLAQLPPEAVVLGIDEHTGCILDFAADEAAVIGTGGVHIVRDGGVRSLASGQSFPLALLRPAAPPDLATSTPWRALRDPASPQDAPVPPDDSGEDSDDDSGEHGPSAVPPTLIEALLTLRADLRAAKQWPLADRVREALAASGITIEDTPDGPRWSRTSPGH